MNFSIRVGAIGFLFGLVNGLYIVIGSRHTDSPEGWIWVVVLPIIFGLSGALLGFIVAALVRWLKEP